MNGNSDAYINVISKIFSTFLFFATHTNLDSICVAFYNIAANKAGSGTLKVVDPDPTFLWQ
jgi:hypothetical protein